MAYRVEYKSFGEEKKQTKAQNHKRAIIAASLVLALTGGALTVKLTGLPWIQKYLLPGDPDVTAAALEQMVEDLRSGSNIGDAVTSFCKEIMGNAQ